MKISLKTGVKIAIIVGVILRLFLALTTYHSDIIALVLSSNFINAQGKIFDFYPAVLNPDPLGRPYHMEFLYMPLAYLIPAILYFPFMSFLTPAIESLRYPELITQVFYLPLLLYKLPLILTDLSIIFLLPKLFDTPRKKQLSQILWALNPLAIFVSSMIAQFDIFLVLFLILALISLKQKRPLIASVFISLSVLIKPIGIILLPLIFIYYLHQTKSLLKSLIPFWAPLLTIIAVVLPYASSIGGQNATQMSTHIEKSIFAKVAISPGYGIPWFFISYSIIALLYFKKRIPLATALGGALFSSLAFTHFHPQWFLWITPWLIIDAINNRSYFVYFTSLIAWFFILFSFDADVSIGMFRNISFPRIELPMTITAQFEYVVLLSRSWLIAVLAILVTESAHAKKS